MDYFITKVYNCKAFFNTVALYQVTPVKCYKLKESIILPKHQLN